MKKVIFRRIFLSLFLVVPIITSSIIVVSCANSKKPNSSVQTNISIKFDSSNFVVNEKYIANVVVDSLTNFYCEWECDNSLNLKPLDENAKQIEINPTIAGSYPLRVSVFDADNKTSLGNYEQIIDIKEANNDNVQYYDAVWQDFSLFNNLNEPQNLTININNNNLNNLRYEWLSKNENLILENSNKQTVTYVATAPGDYELIANIYDENNNKISTKTAYLSFANNIDTPSQTDLLISDIQKVGTYKAGYFAQSYKFDDAINNYGVLKSFALIINAYMRSEFINNGFENVYYQLLKNDSYNDITFKVFGIATKDITNFGYNIPISTIKEGLDGYLVKDNDIVELTIRYKRTSGSNFGNNLFDLSDIKNKTSSIVTSAEINWGDNIGKIKANKMYYTSLWSTYATVKINNKIVNNSYSTENNRSVLLFAHQEEVNTGPTTSKIVNYLSDKDCMRW